MAKQETNIVTEVKTYHCSDGTVYDNKDMAEAHEREIQDPNYALDKRITSLEVDLAAAKNKIKELEGDINLLKNRYQYFGPAAVLNGKQAEDFIDKLLGGIK